MVLLRRCMRNLDLQRSVCLVVVTSFLLWFLIGVVHISDKKLPKKPERDSAFIQTWRQSLEDNKKRHAEKQQPLLIEKLLKSDKVTEFKKSIALNGKDNDIDVMEKETGKLPSMRDKLEKLHKKKLDNAGFKLDVGDQPFVHLDQNIEKNEIFNKLQKLHEGKLNKAGFDVQFNPKLPSVGVEISQVLPAINYNVHLFYYSWFGNPKHDYKYYHWNHPFLSHWNKAESLKWPFGIHKPPDDIGANFYPALGPYSSSDPVVVDTHMTEIRATGAGVLAVSWYPPHEADREGLPSDRLMPLIMDAAQRYQLKVTFHIEPYKDRSHATLRDNIKYILKTYGQHPAFYRTLHKGKLLPMYYIYDSYLVPSKDWGKLFQSEGEITLRGTELDGIFIALLVEKPHREHIFKAGFDGFYTYFASNGFTYGSTWRNWGIIKAYAKSKGLIFIPSVGPGYVDTRIRPWNGANTQSRDHGKYYETSFESAVNVLPPFISVTSYNEWHEGTQIESAMPKTVDNYIYDDYEPGGPNMYLNITKKWVSYYSTRNKREARDL